MRRVLHLGLQLGPRATMSKHCPREHDMYGVTRQALALLGEFNTWEPKAEHWAIKNDFGVWSLFLPDGADGSPVIAHR